jgi:flavin reductase (DIM6/NTAB) family NADH-FMN oxidoreductase RutF
MQFDLDLMPATARYELLLGTVVPRPVAIVTTVSPDGAVNAAPYSLFNVMCHDPPIAMFSVLPHAEQRLKDTASNVLATREFVLNLVPEAVAEAMNVTCIDAPAGIDELGLAGLGTAPSVKVKPPRVAASPVAFECCFHTALSFGPHQAVVIGQVVNAYVADAFILDARQGLVDTAGLKLIGGMHGAKWYARTSDLFAMDRPSWQQWVDEGKVE